MIDIHDEDPENKEKKRAEEVRRSAAVAIKKYGLDEGLLPKISAAGYGKFADQILELAFENGVKVREDADLAEMLATIEVESDIPSEALIAVAEVLSYVYRANGSYQKDKDTLSSNEND